MRDENWINIWSEGYAATGQRSDAFIIGRYKAETFEEAITKYDEEHPGAIKMDAYGKGRHSIWACELFDNEKDARKAFG